MVFGVSRSEFRYVAEISQAVVECSVFQREVVTKQLLKPGYLKEILHCFEMAEEIEDAENVKAAHELIKAGILLNDTVYWS
eukprot:jgi/Picre1/32456/NNA_007802.t1